jgi:hypothetical protein
MSCMSNSEALLGNGAWPMIRLVINVRNGPEREIRLELVNYREWHFVCRHGIGHRRLPPNTTSRTTINFRALARRSGSQEIADRQSLARRTE